MTDERDISLHSQDSFTFTESVLGLHEEDDDEVSFLLVGGTGSGKSATGNSILGRQAFKSKGGHSSVTKTYHSHRAVVDGQKIHVVDTPGFNDTEMKTESERRNLVIDEITLALIQLPKGFHVVVPVTAYNERLPVEANKTMVTMMNFLDSKAFESNGIAVFSQGDAFKRDYPDGNIDEEFKTYINDMPEKYEWIKNSCSERCVLFNNITADTDEKERQQKNLMQYYVKSLKAKERYIPSRCKWSSDKQTAALKSSLKVKNYMRASASLESVSEKLQKAVKESSSFEERALIELKEDARKIVKMLSDKKEQNGDLQLFIEKMGSLDHSDNNVLEKIREIIESEILEKLQKLIESKIKNTTTFGWIKNRLISFFESNGNSCEISKENDKAEMSKSKCQIL